MSGQQWCDAAHPARTGVALAHQLIADQAGSDEMELVPGGQHLMVRDDLAGRVHQIGWLVLQADMLPRLAQNTNLEVA